MGVHEMEKGKNYNKSNFGISIYLGFMNKDPEWMGNCEDPKKNSSPFHIVVEIIWETLESSRIVQCLHDVVEDRPDPVEGEPFASWEINLNLDC